MKIFKSIFIILMVFSVKVSNAENISLCVQGWLSTASKDNERAIILYDECIKTGNLTQSSLARTYRNYAITYQQMAQPEKAIEFENKALSLKPTDAWNDYVNRGNALSDIGRYSEALADYDIAASLKPELADIHYNRGIVFERQKEIGKAKEEFIEAYKKGLRTQQLYERFVVYELINPSANPITQ